MRFLWIGLRKDWSRVRRDPFSLATAIGIPLILAVLMSLVFGGGQATPQGRLLIADEDNSIASNILTGAFSRDPIDKMLLVEKVTREDGRARIDGGKASAFLLIPSGLQEAFLQNRPFHLQLFTNPSERILPKVAEETLSITVDASFYLQRLAGDQLRDFNIQQSLGQLVSIWRRYLNPLVIQVETTVVHEKTQTQSFAATMLPSMIFMGLLFIANTLAADIWKERMQGTLRRLACGPMPLALFLVGRVVFVAMVYFLVATVGLVASHQLAGLPLPNPPAAVLWMVFVGSAFYLLFLLITLQPSTPRAASVLGNLIIFPLSLIGGCFFPFEWMPEWMARIGRLTPNGWAIMQFKAILAGPVDAAQLSLATAVLVAVSGLAFVLALRRLRGAFLA